MIVGHHGHGLPQRVIEAGLLLRPAGRPIDHPIGFRWLVANVREVAAQFVRPHTRARATETWTWLRRCSTPRHCGLRVRGGRHFGRTPLTIRLGRLSLPGQQPPGVPRDAPQIQRKKAGDATRPPVLSVETFLRWTAKEALRRRSRPRPYLGRGPACRWPFRSCRAGVRIADG